jgi:hypothetical protein
MKTINKIFASAIVALASMSLTSCVNDLDLTPTDPSTVTAGSFAQDPKGYMDRVLADVYMSFVNHGPNNDSQVSGFDGGMSTFQRAIFNLEEVPTDEASWISSGDAAIYQLQFGLVSSDNAAIFGAYSRLIINIALCNDFIRTVNEGLFSLPESLQAEAQENVRQCKILRSICYFYMINFFGDVPYADENDPMGTVAPQKSRAEVFTLVTNTLEDVLAEYGTSGYKQAAYGYVGKDVAEAYLVKFYLNAGVFTGTTMYDKCLEHANNLIAAHKGSGFQDSGLANYYHQNFAANNSSVTINKGQNTVDEVLWLLPANTPNITSYGGSTVMLLGWLSGDNCAEYNCGNGWKCMAARTQFVNKFNWNDDDQSVSNDSRVSLWLTSKDGHVNENPSLNQVDYGENGYAAVKLYNWNMNADGTWDKTNAPAFSGDGQLTCGWPMLRLSEIYLSAAEAILNGAGAKSDAVTYVNLIRQRAGLNKWSDSQLTLESLRDERCRELYTECTRRTDLIRYGQWISGYTWNWKYNTAAGTDFPSYYNLYPIPATIIAQTTYKQNPGY